MEFLLFDLIGSGIKWLYFRIRYRNPEKRKEAEFVAEQSDALPAIILIPALLFMLLIFACLCVVIFITTKSFFT